MIHDVIEQGDIVLLDPLLYFQLMAQFWTDQMVRAWLKFDQNEFISKTSFLDLIQVSKMQISPEI